MSQSRSPRLKGALFLILALLAVFLLIEGDGNRALSSSGNGLTAFRGPFVKPLLNPSQVDELHHLVKRMSYKELASLYVSRMTLDEELGHSSWRLIAISTTPPNLNRPLSSSMFVV